MNADAAFDRLGLPVDAAPLYARFGLRNARPLNPAGLHLADEVRAIAREKLPRAAIALEWLARLRPELTQSLPGAPGSGVPAMEPAPAIEKDSPPSVRPTIQEEHSA